MIEEERPVADRIEGVPTPDAHALLAGHRDALNDFARRYASGRAHHAYLVTGGQGVGKATFAFHAARHVLSYPDPDRAPTIADPDSVPAAVSRPVAQGAHPNLLHLARPWDLKGKRFKTQLSVDEVRRTNGFFSMTAGAGGARIAIVDPADDMNRAAANALLKILEEPPANSMFFVLSHSPGRLLPTIRSRCQLLALSPVPNAEIVPLLSQLQPDGAGADDAGAARLSGGSVRRALQLRSGKLLSDHAAFVAIVKAGGTGSAQDWLSAHRIADGLVSRGREDDYDLFLDLAAQHLAGRARDVTGGLPLMRAWADLHEAFTQNAGTAAAFNLDRKQVILNLFAAVFAQGRRSAV